MTLDEHFVGPIIEIFFPDQRFIKSEGGPCNWKELDRQIQPRELLSHFKGNYYVGGIARENPTKYFCIDLDAHTERTKRSLKQRYNEVTKKLGFPHFTSTTPHNGLHLIYLLKDPVKPSQIKTIMGKLLSIKTGQIEIFPGRNGIRLFGGIGSSFLDFRLKPLFKNGGSPKGHILAVLQMTPKIDFREIVEKNKTFLPCPTSADKAKFEKLKGEGLTDFGIRNDSLLFLNRYIRKYLGYTPDEAEKYLIKWMMEKNNGFSRDWNKNSKAVIAAIKSIAHSFEDSASEEGGRFDHDVLNALNLEACESVSLELSERLKKPFDSVMAFMLDLMSYCKLKQTEGLVEIPQKVFRSCRNGSGTRYISYKKELEKMGILSLKVNYSVQRHKCIRYKVLQKMVSVQ